MSQIILCRVSAILITSYTARATYSHTGDKISLVQKAILTRKNQGIVTVHVALQYAAIAAGSPKIIGSLVNQ